MNGDGAADIVMLHWGAFVIEGLGDGSFAAPVQYTVSGTWQSPEVTSAAIPRIPNGDGRSRTSPSSTTSTTR